LLGDTLKSGNMSIDAIKEKFLAIEKIVDVSIEDIQIHNE